MSLAAGVARRRAAPLLSHRVIGALAVIVAMSSTSAAQHAIDWSIESSLSETLEVDDNLRVSTDNEGPVFGASSNASLEVIGESKTHSVSFLTNLGHTIFRGFNGGEDSESIDNRFSATFSKNSKLTDFSVFGTFSQRSTLFSQEEDTGLTGGDGTQTSFSIGGDGTRRIGPTDGLSLSAQFSRSTFEDADEGLVDSDSYDFSLTYSRDVNRTLDAQIEAEVGIFEPAGDDESGSARYTLTGTLNKQVLKNMSVGGSAGVRFVETEGDAQDDVELGSGGGSVGFPFSFDVSFTRKTSEASLGFSREVSPTDRGDLQSNTSARFNVIHRITDLVDFDISAGISVQEQGVEAGDGEAGDDGSDRVTYNISPSLSYSLTPYWSLSLGYRHRFQDSGDGAATSNKVLLTLSHDFEPLP